MTQEFDGHSDPCTQNPRTNKILIYGYESWVMTVSIRSQVQAYNTWFLRRIEAVKLMKIEPLLLRIERSQLRWFGHVSRMPQGFPNKLYLHKRPVGRPRTRREDYIEDLEWNHMGFSTKRNVGGGGEPWCEVAAQAAALATLTDMSGLWKKYLWLLASKKQKITGKKEINRKT